MADVLETLAAPFYAIVDLTLAAPTAATIVSVSAVAAAIAVLVAIG